MAAYQRIVCVLTAVLPLVFAGGCGMGADVERARGYDALRRGDTEGARAHFEQCIEKDATDWKSHYYMGVVALEGDDAFLARRHLESAESLRDALPDTQLAPRPGAAETYVPYPTRAQIADALAQSMFRQGLRERLFNYLQKHVREHGEPDDYYRMALYMARLGDRDGAELAYKKASLIAPANDATPHLKLAEFYDSVGDRAAALLELRKAYTIDPTILGLADNIRAHGMVPGPTIRIVPERLRKREPVEEAEEVAPPDDGTRGVEDVETPTDENP